MDGYAMALVAGNGTVEPLAAGDEGVDLVPEFSGDGSEEGCRSGLLVCSWVLLSGITVIIVAICVTCHGGCCISDLETTCCEPPKRCERGGGRGCLHSSHCEVLLQSIRLYEQSHAPWMNLHSRSQRE